MTSPKTFVQLVDALMTASLDAGWNLAKEMPEATRRAKIRADRARTALLKAITKETNR